MTVLVRLTKTGNYPLALTDQAISASASGGPFTLTLPTAVGNDGLLFSIKKTDSSTYAVTIEGNASETIDGMLNILLTEQNQSVALLSNGAGWEIR